jgi:O-antigen/teichoic acid export membrane protein
VGGRRAIDNDDVNIAVFSIAISATTQALLLAINHTEVFARLNLLRLILTVGLFLIGVHGGLIGAGLAFVMVWALIVPFHLFAVQRYGGISQSHVISCLLPIFESGAMMAAMVYIAGELVNWGYFTLILQMVIGVLVYAVALYGLSPDQTSEVLLTVYHSLPAYFRVFGQSVERRPATS